ncbi:hypothetical protein Tco_1013510 [Tanacetum coccineum]
MKGLETERERLKKSETQLLQENDGLKHERVDVVAKVVPHVATKLVRSDEMGLLVAWLVKTDLVHGRCTTFKEVADLKEPFKLENNAWLLNLLEERATTDPYAPFSVVKKPKSFHAKPAPSQLKSKPSSLKNDGIQPALRRNVHFNRGWIIPSFCYIKACVAFILLSKAQATTDPYAPFSVVKKPKSFHAKPAPSQLKSKPSSLKNEWYMPSLWQKTGKIPSANCFTLSEIMIWGTSNMHTMCSHTNFSICFPVIDTRGFASTHFVKYSIATTRNLAPPRAISRGPTISIPHWEKGHTKVMDVMPCFGLLGTDE